MTEQDVRLQYKRATGVDANTTNHAEEVEAEHVVDFTDIECHMEDLSVLLDDLFEKDLIGEDVLLKIGNKQTDIERALDKQKKESEELVIDIELNSVPYIVWLEEQYIDSITAKDRLFK